MHMYTQVELARVSHVPGNEEVLQEPGPDWPSLRGPAQHRGLGGGLPDAEARRRP
jgi:hypothetical protein